MKVGWYWTGGDGRYGEFPFRKRYHHPRKRFLHCEQLSPAHTQVGREQEWEYCR